ncbi:fimbrial biogenesis chaperone [Stenotrophomonas sp. NRRL B-14846]|uniref:fimbrial biogenesis chaperone n=1 Tax=Stenotrophomonas sp. NRRL B-14846 TaxID=3162882 RepID=UPI003D26EA5C
MQVLERGVTLLCAPGGVLRQVCVVLLSLLLGAALPAQAQVSIPGTRVVFPAERAEVVVPVKNRGETPVLVQAWVADGDADQPPEESKAPFVLAPPMIRLDAGRDAFVRVRQVSAAAPSDRREHLYWLNILAIPPRAKSGENNLELAVRSRYKVLFRPAALPPPPVDRMEGVTVSKRNDGGNAFLVFTNRTAYHLNLGRVAIVQGDAEIELDNPFAPPFGEAVIALPPTTAGSTMEVRFSWLDDEGRLHPVTWRPGAGLQQ